MCSSCILLHFAEIDVRLYFKKRNVEAESSASIKEGGDRRMRKMEMTGKRMLRFWKKRMEMQGRWRLWRPWKTGIETRSRRRYSRRQYKVSVP